MSNDEESIATAILSALDTNMGTQIAAVVTDKGDAVTPPTPKLYYPSEQHELPGFSASNPVCTVLIEDATSDEHFISGPRDFSVDAVITLGYMHTSETTLQTYCYRASRALSKIVWDKSLNGLGAVGAKTVKEYRRRSPMLDSDSGGFRKLAQHVFTIRYLEDY